MVFSISQQETRDVRCHFDHLGRRVVSTFLYLRNFPSFLDFLGAQLVMFRPYSFVSIQGSYLVQRAELQRIEVGHLQARCLTFLLSLQPLIISFLFICFEVTLNNIQGILLALYSGGIPSKSGASYGISGLKANSLPAVSTSYFLSLFKSTCQSPVGQQTFTSEF